MQHAILFHQTDERHFRKGDEVSFQSPTPCLLNGAGDTSSFRHLIEVDIDKPEWYAAITDEVYKLDSPCTFKTARIIDAGYFSSVVKTIFYLTKAEGIAGVNLVGGKREDVTVGDYGSARVRSPLSVATAGYKGAAAGVNHCISLTGALGYSFATLDGLAASGSGGTIQIEYYNTRHNRLNWRKHTVGEKGILANTLYFYCRDADDIQPFPLGLEPLKRDVNRFPAKSNLAKKFHK